MFFQLELLYDVTAPQILHGNDEEEILLVQVRSLYDVIDHVPLERARALRDVIEGYGRDRRYHASCDVMFL